MAALTPQQLLAIALQHHQAERLGEAEALYRQVLSIEPDNPEALHLHGVLIARTGRRQAGIESIRRAIQLNPAVADYFNNLGPLLLTEGGIDEAIDAFQQAIALQPDHPQAWFNLGFAFRRAGKISDSIAAYQRAVELRPEHAQAHNNLGAALKSAGMAEEAAAAFQRAISLEPGYAEAHFNLGLANQEQGRLDDALACFDAAAALKSDFHKTQSGRLFLLHFHPRFDAPAILAEHLQWDQQYAQPLKRFIRAHGNDRDPDRRLRIGYVSPNFRDHCQAYFTVPLFSRHDHERFSIICYSDVLRPDAITGRLRACADGWRETAQLSDEELAETIARDRIDVLVDLTMHMGASRLLTFARKPAPVQVSWLAYPGTTGVEAIDYRLTDSFLDPPGASDSHYSERSVRLPDCFWCYDPLSEEPAVNAPPAAHNDYVTFGCLNNFCKVNDAVLEAWAGVMRSVDRSRLMLLARQGNHRGRTLDVLRGLGIDAGRVEFVDYQPREKYLREYHRIDIGLDTFPYNGHTTSLDSFWMGVPVVTLLGATAVGRAGWCQLCNLSLQELAADNQEQFVQIAAGIAGDLPRLAEMRAGLRNRMRQSPLMNAERFARHIEQAYREMWQTWCRKGGS